jgi:hypothetical protein
LNQSPELYELRSSDLDRSRSDPAATKPIPCPKTTNPRASTGIRTRPTMDVDAGSLNAMASYRISLSWAST